jgi:4-amino-4-deoxy-L-arabinose transferase-like glycosyltransferase
MMEGSVLCFGLLTILLAILISQGRNGWRWWLLMGIASGLTLASKHSGIVYVVAAFGWVIIKEIPRFLPQRRRESRDSQSDFYGASPRDFQSNSLSKRILSVTIRIIVSTFLMAVVFIGLSPAQWNNPVARLSDLVSQRAELLESQVKAEPSAPTPISERIEGIISQPYMQAPVYFEVGFWAGAAPVQTEIAQYDGSVVSGLHAGAVLGGILTLLAVLGILISARDWRTWKVGVLLWLAIIITSLLVNPLPWQRYYLALYPVVAVLTAVGVVAIIRWIQRRSSA